MRKHITRFLGMILCLCLLFCASFPANATENTDLSSLFSLQVLHIKTVDDFLEFAENCRLDSYSHNLIVILDKDLDFTGVEFHSVPTFGGVFEGGRHTISGITLEDTGSNLGLFRYLQPSARVRNLTVEGSVTPSGSRNIVGGIAGNNAGKIMNCHFAGTLVAADRLGGIAGINAITGIIENCSANGTIIGNHFAGGIAGENIGVIRNCENSMLINTTSAQNSIDLEDITIDTLTNSEAANTVTDIGGIAGYSSGVIRSCINYGDIGYKHMGYNIGGIAGSQSGYLVDCINYAKIDGRKEVGGIVGQMEPVTTVEYSEDTLQILKGQLNEMSVLTNRASANAQFSAHKVGDTLNILNTQVRGASDALDILLPDYNREEDSWSTADEDTRLAAQNSLTANLNAIPNTINIISANTQHGANVISRDMNAISKQANEMSQTIDNAEENLGGTITDISDRDTALDLTGKVADCVNYGNILADLNVGGIAGAIAFENDLDPEEDVDFIGESSLNFDSEVRAVILDCKNTGTVTVKKQQGGGIVGWMSLGLVKQSTNTGTIDGSGADYAGGIAGNSASYIRSCHAKCVVDGSTYVGGVAGNGTTVSDCRSMVRISGTERVGEVLGFAEVLPDANAEEPAIYSNYYLPIDSDLGAVDGISYASCAQAFNQANFFALENLPKLFETVTLQFWFEDDLLAEIVVETGAKLDIELIPELPQKSGFTSAWENLDEIDLEHVTFDASINGVFTKKNTTLSSAETRGNGLPILLAEGTFSPEQFITLSEPASTPSLKEGQHLLEGRSFAISDGSADALHYQPHGEYHTERLAVLIKTSDGTWQEVPFRADGSYIVFDVPKDADTFYLIQKAKEYNIPLMISCGAGVVVLLIVWVCVVISRKVKRKRELAQ